jgi:hypothetical protein
MKHDSVTIDQDRIAFDSRFDGKWVLKTHTDVPAGAESMKAQRTPAGGKEAFQRVVIEDHGKS